MTRYFGSTKENQSRHFCVHKDKKTTEEPCWTCQQTRSNFVEVK